MDLPPTPSPTPPPTQPDAPTRVEPAAPRTPPADPNRRLHMFISYRREDSSGQAGRLYDSLSEHFGARNVFMDLDTIQPGEDFVEVIDDALKNCDCVLVVIGPRWLAAEREGQRRLDDPADYLRIEVEHSLARAPRVIPVLVQDADMPGSRDLPEAIKSLARRNAFDLSDSRWRLDVGRLIDALEQIEISLGIRAAEKPPLGAGPIPAATQPHITGLATSLPPASAPTPAPATARAGGASRPPTALPPWVPPWIAQRIVPIAAVLALVAVVALAVFVLAKGSPAPSLAPPTTIAVASTPPQTNTPQTTPPPTNPSPTSAPRTDIPTAVPTPTGVATPPATPKATGAGASTAPVTPAPTSAVTPTPGPVLPPGVGLGALVLQINEAFTSADGSFPVTSDERGSFTYSDGAFAISVASTDYSLWSPHLLPASHAVLRARGSVTVGADEATGGMMCGNSSGDYLYGAVGRNNEWVIGTIISNTIQTLDSGTLPSTAQVAPGTPADVRVECAVTGAPTDRVQLVVNGIKVADNSSAPRVGPFNSGALLASSGTVTPAPITFDNVTIVTGEAFRDATESLRGHIPTAFAGKCRAIPEDGSAGQVAALICAPAGSITQAEYYQFDTPAAMNKQFQDLLQRFGSTATGKDCHTGPSSSRYTDGSGKDAGNLACYPNPGSMGGLLITWTNESMDIVAGGITTTGTYDQLATWWADAGPLP